jgi:opacity protein-like surface antigen
MHDNPKLRCPARALLASALLAATSPAVLATDLAKPSNEALEVYQPQSAVHRNFYVRGDLGVGRNTFGALSQEDLAANGGTFISQSIGDAIIIGAGLGMQVNQRFRFDLTGEYRSTAQIKGMDNVTAQIVGPDGSLQANTLYQGNLASYVGLLNGYFDLFKWRGFTPYIGAGVGFAHHKMSGFTTGTSATFIDAATGVQTVQLSNGTALPHSQTNFVWALMAGTSYDLSSNAKLDLGYRYINLGSGISTMTGQIDCVCGTTGQPLKLSDLDAHEFRIGIRWSLGTEPARDYRPLK